MRTVIRVIVAVVAVHDRVADEVVPAVVDAVVELHLHGGVRVNVGCLDVAGAAADDGMHAAVAVRFRVSFRDARVTSANRLAHRMVLRMGVLMREPGSKIFPSSVDRLPV